MQLQITQHMPTSTPFSRASQVQLAQNGSATPPAVAEQRQGELDGPVGQQEAGLAAENEQLRNELSQVRAAAVVRVAAEAGGQLLLALVLLMTARVACRTLQPTNCSCPWRCCSQLILFVNLHCYLASLSCRSCAHSWRRFCERTASWLSG